MKRLARSGLLTGTALPVANLGAFAPSLRRHDISPLLTRAAGKSMYELFQQEQQEDINSKDAIVSTLHNIELDIRRNEPYGRERFMNVMHDLTGQRGKFISVLGPGNCGKSFVMRQIKKDRPSDVVLIDLRAYQGDIVTAMLAQVTSSTSSRVITSLMDGFTSLMRTFNFTIPFTAAPINLNTKELTEKILSNKISTVSTAVREIVNRYFTSDQTLTFIVDDADLAFNNDFGDLDQKSSRVLLDLFVDITKRANAANVVMVTSQLSFPYNVAHKMQFNSSYFTSIVFMGELLPHEVWHVLVDRWRLSPQLAEQFISIYGGDLWTIYNALQNLSADLDQFNPRSVWGHTLEDDILECFEWSEGSEAERGRMRIVLQKLCEDGFAPLMRLNDPIAQHLASKYIGCVIKNTTNLVGLDASMWRCHEECNYGIIPAKQWIRLAIGHVLSDQIREV